MIRLSLLPLLLISTFCHSQNKAEIKAWIDSQVKVISALKLTEARQFKQAAQKNSLRVMSYRYVQTPKGFLTIQRQYSIKNDTILQYFYLEKGELIYAIENITSYYEHETGGVTWGGQFYFSKGRLIDHVTLGHGKSELENWDPEKELLQAFKQARQDVARIVNGE